MWSGGLSGVGLECGSACGLVGSLPACGLEGGVGVIRGMVSAGGLVGILGVVWRMVRGVFWG